MERPDDQTKRHRDGRWPSVLFWITWLFGPASYGYAFVLCLFCPEQCYPPPNLRIALMLVLTHVAAGLMTLCLSIESRPYLRSAEFRLLLLYWAGIAIWLVFAIVLGLLSLRELRLIPIAGMLVAAATVVLIPIVACVRRLRPAADEPVE